MRPVLDGVPATTLWTLHNRATEAARPDGHLDDPRAVALHESIEFPYRATFGAPSQSHALRARAFDAALREHLREHPGGSVVALGEGLQTTFWRLDDRSVRWWSIDLPEIVALRRGLLPDEPRVATLATSALDPDWSATVAAEVDDPASVAITAEGLLMYFGEVDALDLVATCGRRFPGGRMIFDTIPPWFSRRTVRGLALTPAYTAPPMPWGVTVGDLPRLLSSVPGVAAVRELALPPGRGPWRAPLPRLVCALPLGAWRPACWEVRFHR